MRLVFSFFAVALCFATPTVSLAAGSTLENVEMKWKPTSDFKEISAAKLGSITSTVQIMPFKDARNVDPTNKVGENKAKEKKGVVLPVTTNSDISEFVTKNFKETLRKSGLPLTDGAGDYVLTGELTDFFVTETNAYDGSMTLKLVLSKGGKAIWKGTVNGSNSRSGRSYRLDNYMEALSDLTVDLATKLALSQEFKSQMM